jgi:hypothetical protein
MVTVNVLANILPINGRTTGQVSDFYPNLFAPAGFTFAVWGLIYLLLALHVLYQLGLFRGNRPARASLLNGMGVPFSLSCLANAAWIFSWHYHKIAFSVLFMAVILVCLIVIHVQTRWKRLSARETLFIRLPFSVLFRMDHGGCRCQRNGLSREHRLGPVRHTRMGVDRRHARRERAPCGHNHCKGQGLRLRAGPSLGLCGNFGEAHLAARI